MVCYSVLHLVNVSEHHHHQCMGTKDMGTRSDSAACHKLDCSRFVIQYNDAGGV